MRTFFILLIIATACTIAAALSVPKSATFSNFDVAINLKNLNQRVKLWQLLGKLGITTTSKFSDFETSLIRLTLRNEAQVDIFEDAGFAVQPLYKQSVEWKSLFSSVLDATTSSSSSNLNDLSDFVYHNYTGLTNYLTLVHNMCSNSTKLFSIGKSVQGREMWVIHFFGKSASTTDSGLPKPAFKYIANMHGDEVVGRELLVHLADYICTNYNGPETDPAAVRIRRLLSSTNVYLMPTMNPDGFEEKTRYNANGIDLNRNFPDEWTSPDDSAKGKQPEVVNVMNWIVSHQSPKSEKPKFVLSANFVCIYYELSLNLTFNN